MSLAELQRIVPNSYFIRLGPKSGSEIYNDRPIPKGVAVVHFLQFSREARAGSTGVLRPVSYRVSSPNTERVRKRPMEEKRTEEKDPILQAWQSLSDRKLTTEDSRQIQENVSGFVTLLSEWKRKKREATDGQHSR